KSRDSRCNRSQHRYSKAANDKSPSSREAAKPRCQRNRQKRKEKQRALVSSQIIDISHDTDQKETRNDQSLPTEQPVGKATHISSNHMRFERARSLIHCHFNQSSAHSRRRLTRKLNVFENFSHSRGFAFLGPELAVRVPCRSCRERPRIASVVEIQSRVRPLQQAMVRSTGGLFPIQPKVLLRARRAPGRWPDRQRQNHRGH